MASVHEVIEACREAPSNAEQGINFENAMLRYFELDPVHSQRYDKVWRWKDWPGNDGRPDTGIDLVARERDTGQHTAIQCKFYDPAHTLSKSDIDSFFTASGKHAFSNRIIVSTTDKWSSHAEDALKDQVIDVQRIGLATIAESPIDWNVHWVGELPRITLAPAAQHEPRPHQQEAIEAVVNGFAAGADRGKLIMACGTGKTFTALKIAERAAADNGGTARIMFAVPSISLLSQTLREWTAQSRLDLRAFAVCSDQKVARAAEDIGIHDVAIPVTTDANQLAAEMSRHPRSEGLTVVFTTYQSLPVVAAAQELGADNFDLVICDEAHRTTGVTLHGEAESKFIRVHDAGYLRGTRRLYMTATPRIFDENVKTKADEHSAELTSMDDEEVFGPEFHRLSFGAAVERGLLTDYKVIVLTIDESVMAAPLQGQLAAEHGELRLDDASRIVGCWNALAKRAGSAPDGTSFTRGEPPMRRAVAFARDIASSKQVAEVFPSVVDAYRDVLELADSDSDTTTHNHDLACQVRHVDGSFSALRRHQELQWLKAPVPEDECRILSNARCLSEGVDVPALDAVLFLHPRNSVVDVVQSVGRVMRKANDKDYGYIVLPVAVPDKVKPSDALKDNKRFKVVWQVLNALRAHDDRFNAMVNSLTFNNSTESGKGTDRLLGGHIGPTDERETFGSENGEPADPTGANTAQQVALFSLSEWQEAIYARIVDKVGTRTYWEDWAADVADIATSLTSRINALLAGADSAIVSAFDRFLTGLRDNLNESISRDDAVNMLAQHLITRPVFDALFSGHDFARHNPVSRTMQAMVDQLGGAGLEAETAHLEEFYASVRIRASEVATADGKQQVIAELYEKFFKLGFAKQADALGIVYTPVEVVDFILRAADDALQGAFGRGLTDRDVHVLDPFTGTGTFVTRLLQSGLISPADLTRKYASELHANEIMLLAYYIAAVNIETTFQALTLTDNGDGDDYQPFEGIVLADTFQITEDGDALDLEVFPQNNERITRQRAAPINVVIGNPPYSVGQNSANDLNANIAYPTLDSRIAQTYADRSTATNKNSLYDSYLRAFRWATDRIGDTGVVAFVSNGGWIDGNTADGIRLSLAEEYSRIYIYNLRGNARTAGDLRKKEQGNIFGSGARTTIAVWIGVKDPAHSGECEVFYHDIGDYLSREEKLSRVAAASLDSLEWQSIAPNRHGDWVNQRDTTFPTWPVIGTKDAKSGQVRVFTEFSAGLKTGRDAWCYSFSENELQHSVTTMLDQYETVRREFNAHAAATGLTKRSESDVTAFLAQHPEHTGSGRMSWNRSIKQQLARDTPIKWTTENTFASTYRPFNTQRSYFDRRVNDMVYQLPSMFPTPHHDNVGFYVVGAGSDKSFAALMTDALPDLAMWGSSSGQFFSRWTYEKPDENEGMLDFSVAGDVDEWGYRRVDNITDEILRLYQEAVGPAVTKDEIFSYVYGLLHDPEYRSTYAADLKKMLPHIPTPKSPERFEQLVTAGWELSRLHVGYERVDPYSVEVSVRKGADPHDRETWRVQKMTWGKTRDPETGKRVDDPTTIEYNKMVTITGIPEDASRYTLGSRSALGWVLDRYQRRTDKSSGIVSDPNDWCDEQNNPRYIVELIQKVTAVSVETMRIVDSLRV